MNKERCSKRVYSNRRGDFRGHQCHNKAKKDGLCHIHMPEAVAARRKKSDDVWEKKRASNLYVRHHALVGKYRELEARLERYEQALKAIANSGFAYIDKAEEIAEQALEDTNANAS